MVVLSMLGFMSGTGLAGGLDCDNAGTQAEGTVTLRSAQRAWIAYRHAQCAFETAGSAGGSASTMVVSLCRDAQTRAQTDRLSAQLNCAEGGLSCAGQ